MAKITTSIPSNTHKKLITMDISFETTHSKKPVIIFCHGFKGFKDWGGWSLMANEFAVLNMVSVNMNFSHNGTTPDDPLNFSDLEAFGNNNYGKELDDIKTVVDWIINKPEVFPEEETDHGKIALIGHSRGGSMALLASMENPNINVVVSLAPIFNPIERILNTDLDKWKSDGVIFIENSRTNQKMPLYYQFYDDIINNKDRYNLPEKIKHLNKPALIIHGSKDPTVDLNDSIKLKEKNNQIKLEIIEGANHVFGMTHPIESDSLPVHMKLALKHIVDFLNPLRYKK
ncbi:alpha/beta hydrolase family protein [Marinigracilibium pacificum]|uniref:Alpha/beta fold hydrolase n=1 Tax=Marinigracilibium pacificum TaxID=2729599 RepID=A0A848J1Y7_9BACT|nr:alpha/beta fold hydrolase [Marinigracilibium pacificum]NMM48484.1 alpha/beta fold hydrolase [Marinigracilibium pacificum]